MHLFSYIIFHPTEKKFILFMLKFYFKSNNIDKMFSICTIYTLVTYIL